MEHENDRRGSDNDFQSEKFHGLENIHVEVDKDEY